MLQRTALHDSHLAAGAKMVDFAGWSMPLAYGSQLDEHHRVRRAAGMFDVSHMLNVDVEGAGAREFLRTLLANDVAKLAARGRALYACMLNAAGGVIDDCITYLLDEGRYCVVVNASTAEKDVAWMKKLLGERGLEARIAPRRDLAMIALQGPQARDMLWRARPRLRAATEPLASFSAAQAGEWLVARTGYTGEDGFEIVLPQAEAPALWRELLAADVAPCGLGARDTLRLEAGMNLYGNDMDESTSPLESGLGWTVDLGSPRDFVGRAALERAQPARALVGLKLLGRGVLRARMRVESARGPGQVTSGGFSPTLGFSIAMARVPRALQPGDEVEVEVRGKRLPARVVKLPFVRHGKALV